MPTPDNRDDELLPEAETRDKQTKENIKECMEEDTEEEYVRRTAPLWAVMASCALGLLILGAPALLSRPQAGAWGFILPLSKVSAALAAFGGLLRPHCRSLSNS